MWHDMTQLRFDIFATFDIFLLLKEFICLSVGYIMYNKSFNMSSVRLLSFIQWFSLKQFNQMTHSQLQ